MVAIAQTVSPASGTSALHLREIEPVAQPARGDQVARFARDGGLLVAQEGRWRQQILSGQAPDASRIGVWKKTLSGEECRAFESVAGDALAEFGYETPCNAGARF